MHSLRSALALWICISLIGPSIGFGQAAAPAAAAQKYKLTIIEGASTSKRVKKGRVSSQAVVKVTDQNDVPVGGVAVFFAIPQGGAGGATFANGGLTTMVTTNSAGVASSGSFTASPGSSVSISASASGPGGVATVVVPVTVATAAAATAAGISTGLLIGIIAGGAAAVAGITVGVIKATGSSPAPQGTIGAAGAPTFGGP